MSERLLQTLRHMAWERAKGELLSMLDTYYDDKLTYDEVQDLINTFIEQFEGNYK
ncbi:hypothetical protein N9043_00265 [bacterium]|nr:hypothetical protein [bacterium]